MFVWPNFISAASSRIFSSKGVEIKSTSLLVEESKSNMCRYVSRKLLSSAWVRIQILKFPSQSSLLLLRKAKFFESAPFKVSRPLESGSNLGMFKTSAISSYRVFRILASFSHLSLIFFSQQNFSIFFKRFDLKREIPTRPSVFSSVFISTRISS